jgi:hypothetical protein
MSRRLILLMVSAAAAHGQSFEVAAINPHSDTNSTEIAPTGGRFYTSITLKYMIQVVYDIAPC